MNTGSTHNRFLRPKTDPMHPRVPAAPSMIEEELVYEARSPLYYQLKKSASKDVSISASIAKRLSGLVLNSDGVCDSVSNQEESLYRQRLVNSPDSGVTCGVSCSDQKDTSLYQSISPYAVSIPRRAVSSLLPLDRPK
ncbi:hypothetical protein OSTOST_21143 [Ostertagia ostertagi]